MFKYRLWLHADPLGRYSGNVSRSSDPTSRRWQHPPPLGRRKGSPSSPFATPNSPRSSRTSSLGMVERYVCVLLSLPRADGCTQVMIVNVNPYDTGFDENAHVMRFSAVAREIQTTASNKVGGLRRQISTHFSAFRQAVSAPMKIKVVVPVLPMIEEGKARFAPEKERESQAFVMVEEEIEIIEEQDSDEEDDRDLLVEHQLEQLKELKTKVRPPS